VQTSKEQLDKTLGYIKRGCREGARLCTGAHHVVCTAFITHYKTLTDARLWPLVHRGNCPTADSVL